MIAHSIAIDFGTTRTSAARIDPISGDAVMLRLSAETNEIPTAVAIDQQGHLFFGVEAEQLAEQEGITCLRSFKMALGSPEALCSITQSDGTRREFFSARDRRRIPAIPKTQSRT